VSIGWAGLASSHGDVYSVSRARLESSIVDLPEDDQATSGWRRFADGNVSDMTLGLAYGPDKISDASIEARATVAGVQYRSLLDGGSLLSEGDRVLFGVVVGTQYSLHRYAISSLMDDVFLIDAPAVTVRLSGRRPDYRFSLALDTGATLGGMSAFALDAYRRQRGDLGLTSVAREHGYNYVAGFTLAPRATLELEGAELGISARGERVTAFRVFDRYADASSGIAPIHELRRRASLWLSVGPRTGIRFTLSTEALERSGSIGNVQASSAELGFGLSVGVAL